MKFSYLFIDRPILAGVVSIFIVLIGGLAYFNLPLSQYPEVVPPTINVSASYPGADAATIAATIATPIEQEINGVEGMLYMTSQSSNDGRLSLNITFELGTDLDQAQVLVQNRVSQALPRLPDAVRQLGVFTRKRSPDLLLVVHLRSPDDRYDNTYIGNYAYLQLRDGLSRIEGVGDISFFGSSAYAMRIWLNPDKVAALGITASEVVAQLQAQNTQVASGMLNQSPITGEQNAFEINIRMQGRLSSVESFENVIIKSDENGQLVRLKDIGRVEIGAEVYATRSALGSKPAVGLGITQRPGTNAIETAEQVKQFMKENAASFPPGLEYAIEYNPTVFVEESVEAVIDTLYEALILVVLVILVFLQSWRAALIPIAAIPVSLIGTFGVMQALGLSLNNLSLFGLVLAIGIVVDDAIVVVENVERRLSEGDSPREAVRNTMKEVGGALVAMGLVLVAVFLPSLFLEGISGQFFRQFGITISVSTVISVFVSLTLSPALAKLLLKPHDPSKHQQTQKPWYKRPVAAFTEAFNHGLERLSQKYGTSVARLLRMSTMMLLVYVGLLVITGVQFNRIPSGFIPQQDQGLLITAIQLPAGASLSRTEEVVNQISEKIIAIPGVQNTVAYAGLNAATRTNTSNSGAIFTILEKFDERTNQEKSVEQIMARMQEVAAQEKRAVVNIIQPPPVRGIGTAGGFKMMVQDRSNQGLERLNEVTQELVAAANQEPSVARAFTVFENSTPQLYLDVDRVRAEKVGVPLAEIFRTLEVFIGSAYINDFNYLGRTYRVTAQADAPYRLTPDDVMRLRVRNKTGEMMPLGTVASFKDIVGPDRVQRYNLFNAIAINGANQNGYSSGEALDAMERLAEEVLPEGFGYEWTEVAYQQRQNEGTEIIAFALAVLFVFLLLAAQFESLIIPMSVILVVPLGLLAALVGLDFFSLENDILTQIGMVVLIGLASKNAILIVEFAKQKEDEGLSLFDAAKEAAQLRLRPILMTSFAFILGVLPLVLASGAGSEMRNSLGVAVFIGMIGVTLFGLFFTPIFYYLTRKLSTLSLKKPEKEKEEDLQLEMSEK
ncbi:MAG: efflux RND transporter permease subunit [Thermonemataceae bacterium]